MQPSKVIRKEGKVVFENGVLALIEGFETSGMSMQDLQDYVVNKYQVVSNRNIPIFGDVGEWHIRQS